MKVLVTGATGFIGGNVARTLANLGYEVVALVRPGSSTLTLEGKDIRRVQGDVRDRESVAQALKGCQAVIHSAALYTFWAPDPSLIYDINIIGTKTVLEEALKAGVSRCVYTSTVSTVGIPEGGIGTEESVPSHKDLTGHYKRSKHAAEKEALGLAERGLPVVVVNPTAPVGPWDIKPTPTGRMVLDFIRGRIPAYVNTGMNLVDVEDVAAGHILALERGRPGERYILGNMNMNLGQMFKVLEEISGKKAPKIEVPIWLAMGVGYMDEFVEGRLLGRVPFIPVEGLRVSRKPMYVNCDKAVNNLGMPQSAVEDALEKAIRWFRDHGYTGGRNVGSKPYLGRRMRNG